MSQVFEILKYLHYLSNYPYDDISMSKYHRKNQNTRGPYLLHNAKISSSPVGLNTDQLSEYVHFYGCFGSSGGPRKGHSIYGGNDDISTRSSLLLVFRSKSPVSKPIFG